MLLGPKETGSLYRHAAENAYAILAVNADSPAAITDCLLAAEACDAPIIIETSLWQLTGHSFGAGDPMIGLDRYLAEIATLANSPRFLNVPVVFHTDHIKGPDTLRILEHAMAAGASSISLDSSDLSQDANISHMVHLCEFAVSRQLPAALEIEAGVDDGVTALTEAELLFGTVEKRHPGYLALWAPGVGTQHGLNMDCDAFNPTAVAEHRDLVSKIAGRPIGIALHGSSGLTNEQLGKAVAAGVAKVNWSSESLLLRSNAARDYYRDNAEMLEKGHSSFKAAAMDNGVQCFVSERYLPKVRQRIAVLNGSGFGTRFLRQHRIP